LVAANDRFPGMDLGLSPQIIAGGVILAIVIAGWIDGLSQRPVTWRDALRARLTDYAPVDTTAYELLQQRIEGGGDAFAPYVRLWLASERRAIDDTQLFRHRNALLPIGDAISRVGTILPSPRLYYSAIFGLLIGIASVFGLWVIGLLSGQGAIMAKEIVAVLPTVVLPLVVFHTWGAWRFANWADRDTTWERQALSLLDEYEPYDTVAYQILRSRLQPDGPLNAVYLRLWRSREDHAIRAGEKTVATGRQARFLAEQIVVDWPRRTSAC